MPTKRRQRSRSIRQNPASGAIEDFIHCRISESEFSEAWGNRFATPFDKGLDTGKLALEVWRRDGEQLLKEAGGAIHPNLRAMLSTYGEPWKAD